MIGGVIKVERGDGGVKWGLGEGAIVELIGGDVYILALLTLHLMRGFVSISNELKQENWSR